MVKFMFFFIVLTLSSCKLQYDGLVIQRNNPKANLNLSGYYCGKIEDGRFTFYYLYENGASFGGFSPREVFIGDSLKQYLLAKNEFFSTTNLEYFKSLVDSWGITKVDNNIIYHEQWEPPSGGTYRTFIKKGVILNSTTFVFTEKRTSSGKFLFAMNDTFRLMPSQFKPDSTNQFIK
jgi:hypothetical protein